MGGPEHIPALTAAIFMVAERRNATLANYHEECSTASAAGRVCWRVRYRTICGSGAVVGSLIHGPGADAGGGGVDGSERLVTRRH